MDRNRVKREEWKKNMVGREVEGGMTGEEERRGEEGRGHIYAPTQKPCLEEKAGTLLHLRQRRKLALWISVPSLVATRERGALLSINFWTWNLYL